MNEDIVNKGITEDYIWHEAASIRAKLKSTQIEFEEFVMVVAERDKNNRTVIAKLYAENAQMNQEIKDLLLKTQAATVIEEWRKTSG
jgi:hypothetical protein